jgi:hypothetical protein
MNCSMDCMNGTVVSRSETIRVEVEQSAEIASSAVVKRGLPYFDAGYYGMFNSQPFLDETVFGSLGVNMMSVGTIVEDMVVTSCTTVQNSSGVDISTTSLSGKGIMDHTTANFLLGQYLEVEVLNLVEDPHSMGAEIFDASIYGMGGGLNDFLNIGVVSVTGIIDPKLDKTESGGAEGTNCHVTGNGNGGTAGLHVLIVVLMVLYTEGYLASGLFAVAAKQPGLSLSVASISGN